jgi:lipid-binding SYLF domain-containing protein
MRQALGSLIALFVVLGVGARIGHTQERKPTQLERAAIHAKQSMVAKEPSLQALLDEAAGYIVFPQVKQGGFIFGGAKAHGVVYHRGQFVGFAQMRQASVGAQVGAQRFAELVIVRDQATLDRITSGALDLGGQATAVILRHGATAATRFGENGVAVVINPIRGAMAGVSVSGQRIRM